MHRFSISILSITIFLVSGICQAQVVEKASTTPRSVILYSDRAPIYASEWTQGAQQDGWTIQSCLTKDFESRILPKIAEYDAIITGTVWNLYDKVDFTQIGPKIADWVRSGGVLILGDQNYGPQLDFLKSFPAGFYHGVTQGFYWENGKRPGNMKLPPPEWVADVDLMHSPMNIRPYLEAAARPCWQSLGELDSGWSPLVRYKNGHILMACRPLGRGMVLSLSYYMSASFPDFQGALLRNLWCHQCLSRCDLELTRMEINQGKDCFAPRQNTDNVAWAIQNKLNTVREIVFSLRIQSISDGKKLEESRILQLSPKGTAVGFIPYDFRKSGTYQLALEIVEDKKTLLKSENLQYTVLPPLQAIAFKSYFYTGAIQTTLRLKTPTGMLPHNAVLSAVLTGPNKRQTLCRIKPGKLDGDFVITAGVLPTGIYQLRITTYDRNEKLASVDVPLTVFGSRRVMFDSLNNCLVDGRPTFPLGIYFPKPSRFSAVRQQGFNFMYWLLPRGWGTQAEYLGKNKDEEIAQCLQLAEQAGFMNMPYFGAEDYDKYIPLLKTSRTTLSYYLWDEPDEAHPGVANMSDWYHKLRRLDPDHPVFLLSCRPDIFDLYSPYCDIYASDPYPLGQRPLRMVAEWTDQTVASVHGEKPVWMTLWAYGDYKDGPRLPTPAELNCMSWLAIAHGAKGLFWYCYYTGAIGRDKTLEDYPELWAAFKPMLAAIKKVEPMLFAPPGKPMFSVQTEDLKRSAALHALERRVKDKRYLLLVNDEDKELSVTVRLGKSKAVRDLLTDKIYQPDKGALKIDMGGYKAMVLEVDQ